MPLPRKNRLTAKKEISRIFKKGRTVKGSFLFIKLLDNEKRYSRFAFIVPSKYVLLAVDRNRAKRLLSEGVMKASALSWRHYDMVVYVFRKVTRSELNKLYKDLKEISSKI